MSGLEIPPVLHHKGHKDHKGIYGLLDQSLQIGTTGTRTLHNLEPTINNLQLHSFVYFVVFVVFYMVAKLIKARYGQQPVTD